MASLRYKLFSSVVKLSNIKKKLSLIGIEFDRFVEKMQAKAQLKLPEGLHKGMRSSVKEISGIQCSVIRPEGTYPDKAVIYLFGGGFIMPPDKNDLDYCIDISKNTGAEVWMPVYPLAPGARIDEIIEKTLSVYKKVLEAYPSDKVWFYGQSSGASLSLYLCSYIRLKGLDLQFPHGLILSSPLFQYPPDREQQKAIKRLDKSDVILSANLYKKRGIGQMLECDDKEINALMDVVNSDLRNFPKSWVFMGDREIHYAMFRDGIRALRKAA